MAKNERGVIKLTKEGDDSGSKIEAIKNLIFGENIKAYESEFEILKQDILDKKKTLEDLLEEVKADLSKTIDTIATDVNVRITELQENLEAKVEDLDDRAVKKEMLGELFKELGDKIGKQ
ncbi:fructose 1,6-bisphosphatase [uncultured Maribacter sp.]|uniref:fructose 1,6-bisphosphatase n=1 Tax=uncultured Maribacter sp. TaxID=431308 RepID=UPI002611B712|nr:fructose 1,6-bisphosphatase [uncultured Maribacter sp.]